jgi:hypothetical protein
MRALLASLLVIALSTAGCLNLIPKDTDYDATEAAVEDLYLDLVDKVGQESAVNSHLIAYHNGVDDSGSTDAIPAGGYYTELALHGDRVYLARGSAPGEGRGIFGGFSIIDIQDRERPTYVGAYEGPTGSDIELNDEETLAFFGTQRNSIEELGGRAQSTQDPQASQGRGIHVVDITDKTNPQQTAFYPIYPNGAHTLTYWNHANGNQYLIATTYDFSSSKEASDDAPPANVGAPGLPNPNPATQRVIVYQIQDDPSDSGDPLTIVGQYSSNEVAPEGKWYFPHDTYLEIHPVTGETLLYVSYWDQGLHVVDFDDPTAPVLRDNYNQFQPSNRINVHFARPLDIMVGDAPNLRHITVTEPEIVNADETGYLFFLDTTDPNDIQKAGPGSYWTLPGEHIVNGLDYSPHNFDVRNGIVALAHNQAGVWFIDASTLENVKEPKTTGYYLPENVRSEGYRTTPWTWGTRWLDEETVLISDEGTGLHIVAYEGPNLPPE